MGEGRERRRGGGEGRGGEGLATKPTSIFSSKIKLEVMHTVFGG